jgi:hypothetical protein
MSKRGLTLLVSVAAVVALSGCNETIHDLEGVKSKDPQNSEIYTNVDGHPNLVRFCIDKVAFVTTTRDHSAVTRVPEWDVPFCGATPK